MSRMLGLGEVADQHCITPPGARRAAHRRKKGVAPLAIVACMLVITTSFFFVTLPATASATSVTDTSGSPACIKCPDGVHCYPNCSPPPPPCNPTQETIQITNFQKSAHSTNVTITWQESPNWSNTSTYLDWGNTTTYSYSQSVAYGSTYSVFLDFLEPGTTYYIQIQTLPFYKSCTTEYVAANYLSNFATLAETTFVNQYGAVIRGTIYNATGQTHAISELEVEVQCTGQPLLAVYTKTDSSGRYSITPPVGSCSDDGWGYFLVSVRNYVDYPPTGGSSTQWPGYWNESVIIWADQFVNFYLPSNYVSPFVPQVLEFSNAPSGYSDLTFTQTFSTTEVLTHEWSVSGGFVAGIGASGSTSVSSTVSYGTGPYSNGGTLDWGTTFQVTTGNILFNSVYRSWNVTSMSLSQPNTDGFASQYGVSPPTDVLEPGKLPKDAYYLPDANDLPYKNKFTPPDQGYQGDVQTSTTTTTDSTFSIGFTLSAGLPGVPSFDFSAQTGWTQSSSTTSSSDLHWSIGGTNAECYDVFGEGGNPGAYPVTNADMIGIFMWAPVNGGCSGG